MRLTYFLKLLIKRAARMQYIIFDALFFDGANINKVLLAYLSNLAL